MRFQPVPCVVAILCVLLLLPIEFAKADPARAERPVWPPAGSTWATSLKVSGSFGSGVREETLESMGEVEWEGRRVTRRTLSYTGARTTNRDRSDYSNSRHHV